MMELTPAGLITLLTLNVFQTFTSPAERYEAIDRELTTLNPDVATFQEVKLGKSGASSIDHLLPSHAHRIVKGRPGGYVQAIVSRHPILRTLEVPFRNNRARMALGAVIAVPTPGGTREVLVLTTHLDYQLTHHSERRAQLKAIVAAAESFDGPVAVTGDLNFGDGEAESDAIPDTFTDVWRALNGAAPGYTWDREKNPMAKKGSLVGEPSRRLDRIFWRGGRALESRIVFNQRVRPADTTRPALFPSDHYGVFAKLEVR
ncbi:MAG: endonuclease/exonuclease/phosphatase family protein [Myxococcales bacterium]|nr:endonuclease/exonuclease/phosphatase family protein [Myxococcales bacterium]